MDKTLYEILTELFGVSKERAKKAAERETFEQFDKRYQKLEAILGTGLASNILKEGEVLDYFGKTLDEYTTLTLRAMAEMRKRGVTFSDLVAFTHLFSSGKNLTTFLEVDEKPEEPLDIKGLRLFNKGDDVARNYLDALINEGFVIVGGHEHWRSGRLEKGKRGLNILGSIRYQLKVAFSRKYGNTFTPRIILNFGASKLEITDEETREKLKMLRDIVYKQQ